MRGASVMAALVVAGWVTSCAVFESRAPVKDGCGFSWHDQQAPARVVWIYVEPDVRKWPSMCRNARQLGCTEYTDLPGGGYGANIWLLETPIDRISECHPLRHEMEHAMGRAHLEKTTTR